MRQVNFQYVILNFALIFGLSACSLPYLADSESGVQSHEAFAVYVESVFRLQNQLTSEVMTLTESGSPEDPKLITAEKAMQGACLPLNEYVSRETDGLSIGFFLRRRVQKSAASCEHSAREVEVLLRH